MCLIFCSTINNGLQILLEITEVSNSWQCTHARTHTQLKEKGPYCYNGLRNGQMNTITHIQDLYSKSAFIKYLKNDSSHITDWSSSYTPNLCMGGTQFKSWTGHQLSWLRFLWFSSVILGKCKDNILKPLAKPFPFSSHLKLQLWINEYSGIILRHVLLQGKQVHSKKATSTLCSTHLHQHRSSVIYHSEGVLSYWCSQWQPSSFHHQNQNCDPVQCIWKAWTNKSQEARFGIDDDSEKIAHSIFARGFNVWQLMYGLAMSCCRNSYILIFSHCVYRPYTRLTTLEGIVNHLDRKPTYTTPQMFQKQ